MPHGDTVALRRLQMGRNLEGFAKVGSGRPTSTTKHPARGPTETEASRKYRDIDLVAASQLKFAAESIFADVGYSASRAPPCEIRPNAAELWRCTAGDFIDSHRMQRQQEGSPVLSARE